MDLKVLSDDQLLVSTKALAAKEREILTQVLRHLREVDLRKLFSKLQYKSLFDYAVKELGYSADQAGRRIAAMRLLRDLPQVEKKVESGALNLTHLSMAQAVFRKEDTPKEERLQVLKEMENKTTREVEKVLLARSSDPQVLRPDRARAVSEDKIEFRFVGSEDLGRKLERVKGLLAHTQSTTNMADLIERLCDIALAKLDKGQAPKRKPAAPKGPCVIAPTRKPIPMRVKREVWRRAQSRCQNCGSQFALEVDHRRPRAIGGGDNLDNLRLLCRPCNTRQAIEHLGLNKMRDYLERENATS